ncbi:hypothetical protein COLO4_04240 [Corchorus olitorius]|uniref:Uncharacterized protein n=1 Tax=Corchorus olitorius TaxID=93759 RepID=A0A1R3KUS6_9ROSI|nr:hypothetical protein COLO4_04240 [Corchorus olitorius]
MCAKRNFFFGVKSLMKRVKGNVMEGEVVCQRFFSRRKSVYCVMCVYVSPRVVDRDGQLLLEAGCVVRRCSGRCVEVSVVVVYSVWSVEGVVGGFQCVDGEERGVEVGEKMRVRER